MTLQPEATEYGLVFDLSNLAAEDWPAFLFDHPVSGELEFTVGDEEVGFTYSDPLPVLIGLRHVFLNFGEIGKSYSLEQINQGIWWLWSASGSDFRDLLWTKAVPLPERLATIRAMFVPFRDYLADHSAEVMENCFYMWWDLIAICGAESEVRQAYLDTLKEILALDDGRCQEAALHGLGHLSHPESAKLVQRFIDTHPDWTAHPQSLRWLEECRDGTVM